MPQGNPQAEQKMQVILASIKKRCAMRNIAPTLDDSILAEMGQRVYEEYEIDKESRSQWEIDNEYAIALATQVVEEKSEPFQGAANIKFPTLSMASVQFAARAMPQLVKDNEVVKVQVVGDDEQGQKAGRADRIAEHMNYQVITQMEEWEDETDSLLTALPIEGCEFKKTFFSPALGRNVSEWVRPTDLVVNYWCKNLDKAPRATHIVKLLPNEIVERIRGGVFLDLPDLKQQPTKTDENDKFDVRDQDAPHTFYEQHRFWDLDNDGYKEPYTITLHKDSKRVVRIRCRFRPEGVEFNANGDIMYIKPTHYFTRYLFMPAPDGSFYGMGFGRLLGPINTSINMTLNQLHDAGTLANTQGGFIGKSWSGGRGRLQGDLTFTMGEFKQVSYSGDDIRKSIMTLPFKGPDATLFQILELLIGSGEKLGSVTDPIMGESPGSNVPATTTLALIEQGSKVFSSVFKRLFRAFKHEFNKLYRLNSIFLNETEYFMVLDNKKAIQRADYNMLDYDVVPVADPNMVSDTQQLVKAQALLDMLGQGYDDEEIRRRYLEALRIPDREKLIPEEPVGAEPDPKIVLEMQKLDLENRKQDLLEFEMQFKVVKLQADTMLSMSKAEAAEVGPQIDIYIAQMKDMTERIRIQSQEKVGMKKNAESKTDKGTSN